MWIYIPGLWFEVLAATELKIHLSQIRYVVTEGHPQKESPGHRRLERLTQELTQVWGPHQE